MNTKLVAVLIGLVIIGFIIFWFFFAKQPPTAVAKIDDNFQTVHILVNGGYTPEIVNLKQNIPATLIFTRKDASACLDHIILPTLGVNEPLPLGIPVSIDVDTSKAGSYEWTCSMNMFHGKIIIQDEVNK